MEPYPPPIAPFSLTSHEPWMFPGKRKVCCMLIAFAGCAPPAHGPVCQHAHIHVPPNRRFGCARSSGSVLGRSLGSVGMTLEVDSEYPGTAVRTALTLHQWPAGCLFAPALPTGGSHAGLARASGVLVVGRDEWRLGGGALTCALGGRPARHKGRGAWKRLHWARLQRRQPLRRHHYAGRGCTRHQRRQRQGHSCGKPARARYRGRLTAGAGAGRIVVHLHQRLPFGAATGCTCSYTAPQLGGGYDPASLPASRPEPKAAHGPPPRQPATLHASTRVWAVRQVAHVHSR